VTLPIAFTPTPKDLGTDNADANEFFKAVGDSALVNFGKINTYLRAQVPVFGQSLLAGVFPGGVPAVTGAWTAFSGAKWPPVTLTLPARPHGVLVGSGAFLERLPADGSWVGISWKATGPGISGYDSENSAKVALVMHGHVASSRFNAIPANQLVGGQPITITPWYMVNGTTDGTNLAILGGSLQAIALAG
jgi:hypothetical protein